ncbi:MAG: DUF86 domain-containing protein [Tomitella sp.]|nr:DUF86 domain-containing protein [Tomitella sp.]
MTRSREERLADILSAIDRCSAYREALDDPAEPTARMAYDAVLHNLMVIGEAANAMREDLANVVPGTEWNSIIGLRNIIAHAYFQVQPDVIIDVIDTNLDPLATEIRRLLGS